MSSDDDEDEEDENEDGNDDETETNDDPSRLDLEIADVALYGDMTNEKTQARYVRVCEKSPELTSDVQNTYTAIKGLFTMTKIAKGMEGDLQ